MSLDDKSLDGKPLRYLIGGDDDYDGVSNEVIELSYDATRPPSHGIGVKYGNLFNEKYDEQSEAERAKYAPYQEQGDTAEEYNEGQIDPDGQGWNRNLDEQIARAKQQGFTIIEWDNPDSYETEHVIAAVERAHAAGLNVLAKNPMLSWSDPKPYVAHPAVIGVVVERNCGTANQMETLRRAAGKPTLPVWFVTFGAGRSWGDEQARAIAQGNYLNMGVTYSDEGEYGNSIDVYVPVAPSSPSEPAEQASVTLDIQTSGNVRVVINE